MCFGCLVISLIDGVVLGFVLGNFVFRGFIRIFDLVFGVVEFLILIFIELCLFLGERFWGRGRMLWVLELWELRGYGLLVVEGVLGLKMVLVLDIGLGVVWGFLNLLWGFIIISYWRGMWI